MARKRRNKQPGRTWMGMLATDMQSEEGVRQRMEAEDADAVKLLDLLQERRVPFEEQGWTVFNDWLDECYFKHLSRLPDGAPLRSIDYMRTLAFPSCR